MTARSKNNDPAHAPRPGTVVFLTGLPGAGKSTIAGLLHRKLLETQERAVTLLDGDAVRRTLSKDLGFSREDRNANIERIGFVANEIAHHGGIAICAFIAPYRESREKNRKLISKNGTYIEVHVSTPVEVCEERDPKGLYRKARAGALKGFTGVDDPYEKPERPEMAFDMSNMSAEEAAERIYDAVFRMRRSVAVSGGFDPLHVGHLRMFKAARALGDTLVVILNNDHWLHAKKGYVFMPERERAELLALLPYVDEVYITKHRKSPRDMSVGDALQDVRPDIFANGGDRRGAKDIPEAALCEQLGIKMAFNVGGGKVQSSSWMVRDAARAVSKRPKRAGKAR